MRSVLILTVLAPLCACASWPTGSYVSMGADADAGVLAPAIADYVSGVVPAGSVATLAQPQGGDALSPLLMADLTRDGVHVGAGGVPVAYVVAPLDQGVLLRITAGTAIASRYYVRNTAGGLQPGGPMMVAKQ